MWLIGFANRAFRGRCCDPASNYLVNRRGVRQPTAVAYQWPRAPQKRKKFRCGGVLVSGSRDNVTDLIPKGVLYRN